MIPFRVYLIYFIFTIIPVMVPCISNEAKWLNGQSVVAIALGPSQNKYINYYNNT